MSTPSGDDPRYARFRRGASTPSASAAPPPAPPQYAGPEAGSPYAPPPLAKPDAAAGAAGAPATLWGPPGEPETTVAGRVPAPDQLFAAELGGAQAQPLYETPSYDWLPVDADPGRGSGIASIAVGIFVGIVGLFIGIHSLRKSRSVGLAGTVGIVGIVVSSLSMILFGAYVGSWIKYEADLASQCAQVGPGQYFTSSGDVVTCS
ncbi:hypothetical protein EDF46_2636 [Frondihabitans sp. PhB188]|uniref:hypothetical protein n=1 Tax=Frondihabitans sp. PhB188 TaxID=2485200 RepID=UPI000F4A500F|nr:hypothetical protein [Frondihabitans sp. PhB188]ROQ37186.1 hypothetical protein EDF46_2636 [Frondihabitans sp. PhB188]